LKPLTTTLKLFRGSVKDFEPVFFFFFGKSIWFMHFQDIMRNYSVDCVTVMKVDQDLYMSCVVYNLVVEILTCPSGHMVNLKRYRVSDKSPEVRVEYYLTSI
jgi:hypothetical protein